MHIHILNILHSLSLGFIKSNHKNIKDEKEQHTHSLMARNENAEENSRKNDRSTNLKPKDDGKPKDQG